MMRDQGELRVKVARNWERSSIEHGDEVFSRTIVDRVERLGDPILTTNAQADARFSGQESIVAHNLRSVLCVPLKVKGQVTGVITPTTAPARGSSLKKIAACWRLSPIRRRRLWRTPGFSLPSNGRWKKSAG
jgi:hypothetical protein